MKVIYGIYQLSVRETAKRLISLGLPFYIFGKDYTERKKIKGNKDIDFDIIVADSIDRAKKIKSKDNRILLVCDAKSALERTNCTLLTIDDLHAVVELAKTSCEKAEFVFKPWTLNEILEVATTYVFLNSIQTALYKITPYSLRKDVQKTVIAYFYGAVDKHKLNILLESSKKLQGIYDLCNCDEADRLRLACIEAIKSPIAERVAICKKYGFEEFEIVYIIKSYEKEN